MVAAAAAVDVAVVIAAVVAVAVAATFDVRVSRTSFVIGATF